jgi:DNA-binding beta-propeller fold protein YncE
VQLHRDGQPFGPVLGELLAGALSVQAGRAAVPLLYNNQLAVVDLASGQLLAKVPVGIAPFAAALAADGKTAYVFQLAAGCRSPAT